jgi:DNA-binding SARP family transcriptional activator
LLTVEPTRSLELFELALGNFERDRDGVGAYLAWAGAVQALTYEQRSFQLLERWLERLTNLERFSSAFASPEVGSTVINSLVMGLTLAGAESSVVEHWIAQAMALAEKSSDPSARAMTASVLLLNFALRGDSGLASTLLAVLERQSRSGPMAAIGQVIARAAAAALAWHQGHVGASVEAALEGLSLLDRARVPMWQLALLVFGSFAAIDRGAADEGQRFLNRLAELADSGTPLDVSAYHVVRCCHAMARGDLKQALVSVELSLDRDRAVGFAYGQVVDLQICAYLHFELGNEASAREALREARSIEDAHRQPVLRYWRLVIEADRAAQTGAPELALRLLQEAFSVGRELQIFNVHCPVPARLAELCRLAISHGVEVEYARTLVRRRELFLQVVPLELQTWPWPIQIRTFGGLDVRLNDQQLLLGRVRMPLLLLRLLLTEAGNRAGQPISRVLCSLWPESDGDNATHAFDMTVLRLRNQLGEYGRRALRVERGHVMLDASLCWTDTAALSSLISDVSSLEPETGQAATQVARCSIWAERLVDLYRGPFANDEGDVAPLRDYAERVRAKVAKAAQILAVRLTQLGESRRAEALCSSLLEADRELATLLKPGWDTRDGHQRMGKV